MLTLHPDNAMNTIKQGLVLVAITKATTQWAGMAPAVAGGWIMACPVGDCAMARLLADGELLAAVPAGHGYGGREIDPAKAECALREELARTETRAWGRHNRASDAATLRIWIDRVRAVAGLAPATV